MCARVFFFYIQYSSRNANNGQLSICYFRTFFRNWRVDNLTCKSRKVSTPNRFVKRENQLKTRIDQCNLSIVITIEILQGYICNMLYMFYVLVSLPFLRVVFAVFLVFYSNRVDLKWYFFFVLRIGSSMDFLNFIVVNLRRDLRSRFSPFGIYFFNSDLFAHLKHLAFLFYKVILTSISESRLSSRKLRPPSRICV